jgi:NADH-quinone oxidoreductase subunit M
MDSGWLLFATIAVPLTAALTIMAIPSTHKQQVRWVATAAAFTMFVLSVVIFAVYNYKEGGLQFDLRLCWLENVAFLGKDGITLHLAVDGISVPMVLLTGIVIFAGCLISWNIEYRNKDFFILLMLLVSGVFGVFESADLFFFFFFYELAVLPMYLLIGVWGASSDFGTYVRTKEYGAMKLTLYLVAGSALVLIGIFATFVEAGKGTFDMPVLGQVTYSETFQKTFYPFFMLGFGVLAGLWPFHTWSPDGHVAAPTAVSMLHAGVLMKLGAFGIIRVGMSLFPEGAEFWAPALLVLGTTGALYGAISAMAQRDLKYVVGYSSVSHMGYVLMGLATLNPIGVNGAVLQMFAHGVMTALFFAMVGAIYDQARVREIWTFGGLAQRMPRFVAFLTIAGLSSLGLPGLAGFIAEFNIFAGLFKTYPLFGALGILAAAITAVYILRLLAAAFFGPLNEKWANLKEMRLLEQVAGAILIVFIVFMGIWPAPFVDRIAQSVLALPGIG